MPLIFGGMILLTLAPFMNALEPGIGYVYMGVGVFVSVLGLIAEALRLR